MTAWDLYELWGWYWNSPDPFEALEGGGWIKCCEVPPGGELKSYWLGNASLNTHDLNACLSGDMLCGTGGQPITGPWPSSIPPLVHDGSISSSYKGQKLYIGVTNLAGTRQTHTIGYKRWVAHPGKLPDLPHERPEVPYVAPYPVIPTELPYPYPYADPPPIRRPRPEPEPKRWPKGRPRPQPDMPPSHVPSLETGPGLVPTPVPHAISPPPPGDRERKKRLNTTTTRAWWKFLEGTGGTFMELDDYVAAIYKGLPWKLRRWRGRDGVWRDRDHTTVRRLSRLYQLAGKIDIQKAIIELVKNEAGDRAYGTVGRKLSDRTKELVSEGKYWGSQGLGAGTPLNDWDAQKKLVQDEWKRKIANGDYHNWYRVREFDTDRGEWRWKLKQRPVTAIPWYRQRSFYDRNYALTGGPNAKRLTKPRYYYAATRTPRPLLRRPK